LCLFLRSGDALVPDLPIADQPRRQLRAIAGKSWRDAPPDRKPATRASPLHMVATPRTITLNRAFKVEIAPRAPNLIGLMRAMGLMLGLRESLGSVA